MSFLRFLVLSVAVTITTVSLPHWLWFVKLGLVRTMRIGNSNSFLLLLKGSLCMVVKLLVLSRHLRLLFYLLIEVYISMAWNLVGFAEEVPEYDKVVVLWDEVLQVVVFLQEPYKLRTGSVIRDFVRIDVLVLEHPKEESFSVALSLEALMHVKVHYTGRVEFFSSHSIHVEQFSLFHFEDAAADIPRNVQNNVESLFG